MVFVFILFSTLLNWRKTDLLKKVGFGIGVIGIAIIWFALYSSLSGQDRDTWFILPGILICTLGGCAMVHDET
jgi:hypothetical protein